MTGTGTAPSIWVAKLISKNANVGREDVYRVLPLLQQMGLIKKHLESPSKYEVIPPRDAVKILLTRREQENEHLKREVELFLQYCGGEPHEMSNSQDQKTFVVSRDNSTGVDKEMMRLVRDTKHTFDFTTRDALFNAAFNEPGLTEWIDEMYHAAERGVKIRMIMNVPKPFQTMSSLSDVFSIPSSKQVLTHPNFSFRYLPTPPECIMILFDYHASCVETGCKKKNKMSPYMITNNPVFVALNKAYFESLWHKALPEQEFENRKHQ